MYANLQGLDIKGESVIDPTTGIVSPFMNTGDPVTNTGWLDSYYGPPCDVFFLPASGPFSIAAKDTQSIVFAYIVGHDNSRLNSIVDLKRNVNFIRDVFLSRFKVKALAETEVIFSSPSQAELNIRAKITCEQNISSVEAQLYEYNHTLVHSLSLFDDGQHNDAAANDGIYGNVWRTSIKDEALYLNLNIIDNSAETYHFEHAVDYITLSDKLGSFSLTIVDDHLNLDGKANPGENVRLNLEFTNNYTIELGAINIFMTTDDPYVQLETKHLFVYDVAAGDRAGLIYDPQDDDSYVAMNLANDLPDSHTIRFDVTLYDDQHHRWEKQIYLKTEPLKYVPDTIMPNHTAGYSDAYFKIRIIDPTELTGHAYLISVSDSINENGDKGFNLIDQTLDITLLSDHPLPDEYAYNIPITDGFKICEAYLPEGGMKDAYYVDISGGHPTGFEGVDVGGYYFNGSIILGDAPVDEFYKVELEFTNTIDSTGVVGVPVGQRAFRYELGETVPSGFYACPFNAWKIIRGHREGKLNACFQENPYFVTNDNTWAPDSSPYGGFETLYIMKTDYDETGQYYMNRKIDMKEVLYKVQLRLISENSVVDAGDKIIFDWIYPATELDEFTFVATNVIEKSSSMSPERFMLFQNYPNPFNPTTTIKFTTDEPGLIQLKIYNIMGQEVAQLINENLPAGTHIVQWDGMTDSGLPASSGVYFAKLKNRKQEKRIKLVLVR